MVGGVVLIIATFLDWGPSLNGFETDFFGLLGIFTLIIGITTGVNAGLDSFAPQIDRPDGFLGMTRDQISVALGFSAFVWLFGLQSAERGMHDLFTLHRANRFTRLRKLMFPAAMPAIFAPAEDSSWIRVWVGSSTGCASGRSQVITAIRPRMIPALRILRPTGTSNTSMISGFIIDNPMKPQTTEGIAASSSTSTNPIWWLQRNIGEARSPFIGQ